MKPLSEVVARFNALFDRPGDVRALAIIRILVGPIVIYHLWPFVEQMTRGTYYADFFYSPWATWLPTPPRSLYFVMLSAALVSACLMSLGYKTRWSAGYTAFFVTLTFAGFLTYLVYPAIPPWLAVSDGHDIYVESVGRVGGIAAVYLHGGPGSGCQPDHRRLFDPERFHAVLFDQRGAGRSRPKGRREANTLPHLIADMEAIRKKFGFERWMIVGGSWGATLALAYAQAHPDRVTGIVLRATFLGTIQEIENGFLNVLPRFYPGLYDDFLNVLPEAERTQPVQAYFRRILDPNPDVNIPAARAWGETERILSEHAPNRARLDLIALNSSRSPPATPFMEAHYFANDCFMQPNQLLREADRLSSIPGIIVQSRYDLLCPPATSHALGALWREAEIRFVEGAGHTLYDPGVRDAVMKAIADMASRISK